MKFLAYNACMSKFKEIEVNTELDLPGYLWDNNWVRSDDEMEDWQFWQVIKPVSIRVDRSYTIE